MRSVTIPSPLKERLDKYLSAFVLPDIDKICVDSSLSNEEASLIKRYVKSYFSFKKRGNVKDLEIIERIVWNEKLMKAFEDYATLYPFLADIRNELRYLNVFYSDIKGGHPWRKQRFLFLSLLLLKQKQFQQHRRKFREPLFRKVS